MMADFVQVMKDWRRMCNNNYCSLSVDGPLYGDRLCPIAAYHKGIPCNENPIDWTEDVTKQFEEIVMSWAAEHPEPVYPTWKEWLEEQRVVVHFDSVSEKGTKVKWELTNKSNCRIPADIAEKLGLELKEG